MHIGERIGAYRKRKGIPQETLAGLVGKSRSWLSQVERGIRGVDKLSTINDLAAVLRVQPSDLVGQDWKYAPNGSPEVESVAAVRAHLASYSHLLARQPEMAPWPLPQLRAATVEVHRSYQAAKYAATARVLPDLLRAADAYDGFSGRSSREIHLARCMAYAAASKLLTKMGESELAWITADRASHAAMAADSPAARGLAAYQIACALHRAERTDEAEQVATGAAEQLVPLATSDMPDLVSLAGSNLLLAAVIAAQRADRSSASERLTRAEQLSEQLAHDGNHAWTAFGPTNVQIHRASVAAELGDPRAVIREATMVDSDRLPSGLHSRRVQVHLDLAWAQTQAHNDAEAVFHLHAVNRQAAEVLRFNTIAREALRELLRRSRSTSPALSALATSARIVA